MLKVPVYEHKVNISGMQYPLVTDKNIDFVRRVSDILQSRMDLIKDKARVLDTQKLAVMAALSIAAEYLDLKDLTDKADALVDEILLKLDR